MSQKGKRNNSENIEKRKRVRFNEHRPISVEDLQAGILHRAIMLNQSETGLYFESDSLLQPGAGIYLATQTSSDPSFVSGLECRLAEIVWRNKLKKSFYNYGYGVQFISTDKPQEKERKDKKEVIDTRKHPRKTYVQPVLFAANAQILKGSTKNLSLSGIFLQSKSKLEVGQKIILSLPTRSKKRLKISAEVIWSNHEGCGLKFVKKIKK
ncbi:MAG: PilZ domain-containing protein [Deltaproteobacteria bacterium]|jgi:Tfp pilus assembly protein PilZ|nr:PilZ domain-containing protein [Deltaproteobacteria bacterium]